MLLFVMSKNTLSIIEILLHLTSYLGCLCGWLSELFLLLFFSVSGYLMGDVEAGSELTQEGKSRVRIFLITV